MTANNKNRKHYSDVMTPEQRSALMSRIRGKDTGPELAVRRLLHRLGYRFRLHGRDLPGRPDIVFRSRRVVIFVHGCFWHHHNCGLGYTPKNRKQFWQNKFNRNAARDRRVKSELEGAGWRVIVIWECEIDKLLTDYVRLVRSLGPPSRKEGVQFIIDRLGRR